MYGTVVGGRQGIKHLSSFWRCLQPPAPYLCLLNKAKHLVGMGFPADRTILEDRLSLPGTQAHVQELLMVHLPWGSWPQIAPSVSGHRQEPDMLLPPRLSCQHHIPVGPGSGVGAASSPPGGAGNAGDDAREVTVAAPGLGSASLLPGRGAGRAGLVVAGLQDMAGRTVAGDPPRAPPWPGKAAGRLDPLEAGALFARLVGTLPPKNGCRAAGDEPLAGPRPRTFDPGLPAAIPVGGRPGSPGLPPDGE